MHAHIRLGRLFGVEIGLHYSWFIIALLITLSLAASFGATNPGWGSTTIWVSAIITGVLFFTAIVAHELAHALVARRRGTPVRRITLFALGGMAHMEKETADAKTEFWMGIAGPIASLVIGIACLGIAAATGWEPGQDANSPVVAVLVWLGYINVVLAVFNMIPGYPLDGGRILRAAIWWKTGQLDRATRIASRIGQGVAWLFIAIGLVRMFSGAGFAGLWLAFIGWFLLQAARASYFQVQVMETLREVRVGDIMDHDCGNIDRHVTLKRFVDDHLLRTGQRCFLVQDHGQVVGLITPKEIKQIEYERWPDVEVAAAMRPLDQLKTVTLDTPASEAMEIMSQEDINQLPVIKEGHLEGLVSRGHILRLLEARRDLSM